MQAEPQDQDFDFPTLAEIESARHEILDRVAAQVAGANGHARAYHTSHTSGTGRGHYSTVSNRPTTDPADGT